METNIKTADIEIAAKAIYAKLPALRGGSPDTFPWKEGGNSDMQDEARRMARVALEALAERQPATSARPLFVGWRTGKHDICRGIESDLKARIRYLESLVDAYGPKSLQYDIEHPADGLNSADPAEVKRTSRGNRPAAPAVGGVEEALKAVQSISRAGMEFAARLTQLERINSDTGHEALLRDDVMAEVFRWREEWSKIEKPDASALLAAAPKAGGVDDERAECDGGTCGLGGYCDECPKMAAVTGSVDNERKAFEAWARELGYNLTKLPSGEYVFPAARGAWEGWDARHKMAAAKDGQEPRSVDQAAEAAEAEYTIQRLGELLARVAVAVKGPEAARHRHSYHDLPELVETAMIELEIFRQATGGKVAAKDGQAQAVPGMAITQQPCKVRISTLSGTIRGVFLSGYPYDVEQKSERMVDAIAYAAAPPAQQAAVPKGWRLVPTVPTEAMWEATWECKTYVAFDRFTDDYEAMLAAAPSAPAPTTEKGEQ